jgi:hypothetical protein
MTSILKLSAVFAMGSSAALAVNFQTITTPTNGCFPNSTWCYEDGPSNPSLALTATCETAAGFGLMAFSDNAALLANIRARLAAGQTVIINVEGTDVVGISPSGGVRAIGVVAMPNGQNVVCYRTF